MRHRLLLISIILLFVTTACSSLLTSQPEPTPTLIPADIVPNQPTYEVQVTDIVQESQFTGRIVPELEISLAFQTAGRIKVLYVEAGATVIAGQLLAELDVVDELQQMNELEALAIRRAEIKLQAAELQLELIQTQADTATRDIELNLQQLEVELAQIALEELRLTFASDDTRIEQAQIIAPIGGQVLAISAAPNDAVDAFEPVFIMGDVAQLEVVAELQRSRVDELDIGMIASMTHINRPGQTLTGTIRQLPYQPASGTSASQDTNVHIQLDTSPEEAGFELNDRVSVTIVLNQKSDVLTLPAQAIRVFGGREFVVVLADGIQQRVDVELGLLGDGRVEIVSGLVAGQIVVGP